MKGFEQFGNHFKSLRIKKGMTLRNFCQTCGLDAGNMSKLERGMIAPPKSREVLEKYAACLDIKEGSDDWYTFFDLAAVCSGQIPPELMSDEKLVAKLPLIFRTLRGQDVPEDQLEDLAELISRS